MIRSRHRALLAGVGLVAVALAVPAHAVASPPAPAAAPDEPITAKHSTDLSSGDVGLTPRAKAAGRATFGVGASESDALTAYWTPRRMRKATPAAADPKLKKAARSFKREMRQLKKQGKQPTTNDGPVQSVEESPSSRFAITKGAGAALSADNPNAPSYTPTAYTQGKVFFTKPGVGNFVCSGTIVNSEGKDTVWTAGHCVHGGNGGTWHSNWTFVPAYDDDLTNPRPYGTWSAGQLWSKSAWTSSSDYSEDMGVAIMNTRNGWHIVDYFGGQGLTVNRGKTVYERAFGYPAEWPFDGGNLYRCQGTTSPEWDAWFVWSQTVKIGCDMTRGSSGGGWLYGYDGSWGQLNGVNSRIDRILNPRIMLSPYFDNDAWNLYNSTRYL